MDKDVKEENIEHGESMVNEDPKFYMMSSSWGAVPKWCGMCKTD